MVYFWAIAAYLIFLIFVGAYRSRMVKTSSDFMVAGRRLTTPILIGTLLATWIGSGSIIAVGEFSYKNGFAGLWMPTGGGDDGVRDQQRGDEGVRDQQVNPTRWYRTPTSDTIKTNREGTSLLTNSTRTVI